MSIICIDGVVGVGKSSLAKILSERYQIPLFEEPVDDNPILQKFYYDKKRWSFPLQIFFLNKRFQLIKEANKQTCGVIDRSIYGDVIFAKMLVDDQEMTTEEFQLYQELLHNMLEHLPKPRLMIFLEASVDTALQRINKRSRNFEQIVPRGYWESLHQHYTSYFHNYNISPLLKINLDHLDFVHNPQDLEYVLQIIDEKIQELQIPIVIRS